MQQYFIQEALSLGAEIKLDEAILHHIKDVLRKKDGYTFRLVDANNRCFLAALKGDNALVQEELNEDHELSVDITIVMSLIKNDKFDLTLQKLTELGVKRIVPYVAKRSVVKVKDAEKKLDRYRKIVREAAEQCHRDHVPDGGHGYRQHVLLLQEAAHAHHVHAV